MMDEGGAHLNLLRRFSWLVAMTVIVAVAAMFFVAPVSAQPVGAPFDHFATGFALTGTHTSVPCASCHAPGASQSTPRLCASIAITGREGIRQVGKPYADVEQVRVLSTRPRCGVIFGVFEHAEQFPPLRPVAACHNSTIAIGKATTHVPDHRAVSNVPVQHGKLRHWGEVLAHTGWPNGCATCHDGVAALSKPSNHVPTTLPCGTSHTSTVTFANATYTHRASIPTALLVITSVITATGQVAPRRMSDGRSAVQCVSPHANSAPSSPLTRWTPTPPGSRTRYNICHNGSFTSQGNQGAYGAADPRPRVPTSGRDCRHLSRVRRCKLA